MKKFILCLFMLMATSSILRADAITFEATVNSPRISLDEVLQLTLTVTGASDNLDPISLPVLDGFSTKYLGPSTSLSCVNSDCHSERSFAYNLFPNRVGRFQIPPISATISGQTYTTKPIDVEVFQDSTQAQAGASDQNQAPGAESLNDKIMVVASVDSTNVYLNEQVPVTVTLLYNVPLRDIQYPQFAQSGFTVGDFDKPEQGSQVINGVKYDEVEFKTNIYPNRTGDLSIGAQIQGNVLYKTSQNSPFNQDNSLFGADVLNSFFDSYATRPMTTTSQPVVLHVSALPEKNRPADFSGLIGQSFDFRVSVSPLQVKAGDPLTLKMVCQGSGNFKNMKMPVFQAPGFKSYAPQIKDTENEKTAEEVIIPTSVDIKKVPALQFSYFDTSIKDYKTITQGPFAIQVTAPSPDQEFKAVGFSDVSHEPSALATNQFSFEKMFNKTCQSLGKLCQSIWFWVSLGFILVAGVSCFLWQRFQDRLENDPAFARRLKAVKEARQVLSHAEGYIPTAQTKDFYALLSKALRDYLANKWHQPSAALSVNEIVSRLKTAQLDESHIGKIRIILEQCDLVCFAGAIVGPDKMRADLSQAKDLIAHFEKSLK